MPLRLPVVRLFPLLGMRRCRRLRDGRHNRGRRRREYRGGTPFRRRSRFRRRSQFRRRSSGKGKRRSGTRAGARADGENNGGRPRRYRRGRSHDNPMRNLGRKGKGDLLARHRVCCRAPGVECHGSDQNRSRPCPDPAKERARLGLADVAREHPCVTLHVRERRGRRRADEIGRRIQPSRAQYVVRHLHSAECIARFRVCATESKGPSGAAHRDILQFSIRTISCTYLYQHIRMEQPCQQTVPPGTTSRGASP